MEIKFYGAFASTTPSTRRLLDGAPDALVDFLTVHDDKEPARELRAALAEGVAAQRAQRDVLVAAAHGRGRDLAQEEPRADVRGPQADRQRGRRVEARPGADRRDGEDAAADHVARY